MAQQAAEQLPLGDPSALPTATPDEVQTALETISAIYDSMAQVATPEFTMTLEEVQRGLLALDQELARAGYDWDQIDFSALEAVFTPEFDSALRETITYLQQNCQIQVTVPSL